MTDSRARRKKISLYYGGVVLLLLIIGFLVWLLFLRFIEYTDDAYVGGNQVFLTPLRAGFVTSIHTDDTFLAKEGQLLIQLDQTDSKIALNQAQEILAQRIREVCASFHQVFAYQAEIEVKKAEYIKAIQDFEHRKNVLDVGGVSVEDYEHAVAELRSSFFSLKWVESLYDKEVAFLQGNSIRNHPRVKAAADDFRNAWVQLYRTSIYSPVEGLVAQRSAQVGMWVPSGQPLLSLIPLDQIWINANFKETQLKRMKIGQKAKVTSDLYGSEVVFHGKIVGLPGGAGNIFSLLPPQNLSGNWIKIVQRLPVRIALDPEQLKKHPLRVGLSMEVRVDLHDQAGKLVPETSKGSPTYQTSIFEEEEAGDVEAVEKILSDNIDPLLLQYKEEPFYPLMYE